MSSRLTLLWMAVALGLWVSGCKSPCRQLSEKLCECEATSIDKETCIRRAQAEESKWSPTAEQQAQCESLLERCDCNLIDTPEGKRACGLAR